MNLEPKLSDTPRRGPLGTLRANFLTGLVVIAPIAVTLWLIWTVVGVIDGWVLPFIPNAYNPAVLLKQKFDVDVDIRGVGVVFFLIFTVIIGWLAKGLLGRSFIRWTEGIVTQMPVVRSVYGGLKQIVETVVSSSDTTFERACMVEYPRRGIWAIAFISTNAKGEIAQKGDEEMLSVFLPTTPNPTSGFLLFVPRGDVRVLDMSVEDAAKLVISAGLVYPNSEGKPKKIRNVKLMD
ncbi:DUF502 domain-containing protein [Tropicimonas sp. S265A]|uniref:DUF502 domain-containing protein n=1 Tax=Tropicimonas sp. S265A TaxID=3415134 RepID=UPI003C79BA4C